MTIVFVHECTRIVLRAVCYVCIVEVCVHDFDKKFVNYGEH